MKLTYSSKVADETLYWEKSALKPRSSTGIQALSQNSSSVCLDVEDNTSCSQCPGARRRLVRVQHAAERRTVDQRCSRGVVPQPYLRARAAQQHGGPALGASAARSREKHLGETIQVLLCYHYLTAWSLLTELNPTHLNIPALICYHYFIKLSLVADLNPTHFITSPFLSLTLPLFLFFTRLLSGSF